MNTFNQGKQEKPFFEIINWKNLDLYYGFLLKEKKLLLSFSSSH